MDTIGELHEGENFLLVREFVDDGEITSSTTSAFYASCLYDADCVGILSHIESFLRGCGFSFDGTLGIIPDEGVK